MKLGGRERRAWRKWGDGRAREEMDVLGGKRGSVGGRMEEDGDEDEEMEETREEDEDKDEVKMKVEKSEKLKEIKDEDDNEEGE